MSNSVKLLSIIFLLVVFNSCQEDETTTQREKLISKLCWRDKTKVERDLSGKPLFGAVIHNLCIEDNCTLFYEDGNFIESEGGRICDTSYHYKLDSGTWDLSEDGKILILTQNNIAIEYKVEVLTSSRLSISTPTLSGITSRLWIEYK